MANFCIDHFDILKILYNELDNKTVSIQKCIHIQSSRSVKSYSITFFVLVLWAKENCILLLNFSPSMCSCMKLMPITLVDIKTFFSIYKLILVKERTTITNRNMERYVIVRCYMNYYNL